MRNFRLYLGLKLMRLGLALVPIGKSRREMSLVLRSWSMHVADMDRPASANVTATLL
jgi:hypothetical protein